MPKDRTLDLSCVHINIEEDGFYYIYDDYHQEYADFFDKKVHKSKTYEGAVKQAKAYIQRNILKRVVADIDTINKFLEK